MNIEELLKKLESNNYSEENINNVISKITELVNDEDYKKILCHKGFDNINLLPKKYYINKKDSEQIRHDVNIYATDKKSLVFDFIDTYFTKETIGLPNFAASYIVHPNPDKVKLTEFHRSLIEIINDNNYLICNRIDGYTKGRFFSENHYDNKIRILFKDDYTMLESKFDSINGKEIMNNELRYNSIPYTIVIPYSKVNWDFYKDNFTTLDYKLIKDRPSYDGTYYYKSSDNPNTLMEVSTIIGGKETSHHVIGKGAKVYSPLKK